MVLRYTALILAQLALYSPLSAQVRLDSDPSTPVSNFVGPVADFNGDGIPDFANYNEGYHTLVIWLGEGNGLFKPVSQQPGLFQRFLFAADLNQDGKVDIVSVQAGGDTIGVLFGNGDGTFHPQVFTNLAFAVYEAALGDLNGDGIPDLVLTHGGNLISPLLGKSDGTFTPAPEITVAGGSSGAVIGDFNNDGYGDFAVSTNGSTLIYYGQGNGEFSSPQSIATSDGSVTAAADVNGDGFLDLVTESGDGTTIYLNSGTGTFNPSFQTYLAGGLAFGDVTGDGKVDLISAPAICCAPQAVFVLPGNGDGTFQTPSQYAVSGEDYGANPYVFLGDFNADGIPDILVGSDDALCVLAGTGGGNFLQPLTPPVGTVGDTTITATADFNHDGLSDLVFSTRNTQKPGLVTLQVALNNGDNTFAPAYSIIAQYAYDAPFNAVVGDLNNDGNQDIIAISASLLLTTALSNADGSFLATAAVARLEATPIKVAVADFDDDGNLDIAVLIVETKSHLSFKTLLEIFPGKGDGTVGAPTSMIVGSSPYGDIAIGDFNGDGYPDIAVFNDDALIVLTNSGAGTFTPTFRSTLSYGGGAIAAGDINQDGFTDLVITNGSGITELISDGAGGFSQATNYRVGFAPGAIAITDLNGDGYPEVLTENLNSQDISLLNNNGGTLSYGGSWYGESAIAAAPILTGHFLSTTELSIVESDSLLRVKTQ